MIRQLRLVAALLVGSAASLAQAQPIDASRLNQVIAQYRLSGEVQVGRVGDKRPLFVHRGPLPERRAQRGQGKWRLASVTKQITAVLIMQEVAAGRISLDQPVSRYLPAFRGPNAGRITVRNLLQHRSGLPNPDDSAAEPGQMPAFYRVSYRGSRDPLTGFCAGPAKGEPGGNWAYNNCDYMLLGSLLERVTGQSWTRLVDKRIAKVAGADTLRAYPTKERVRWGMVGGKREPDVDLASFGPAGGLYGSAADVLAFDHALMSGRLLGPDALATLWKGDPALGYMALGQWVFEAKPKGCSSPVRLVERRGAIGGIGVRNFIVPERRIAMVVFSDQAEFGFGEIWRGKGAAHDMLSAVLCSAAGQ